MVLGFLVLILLRARDIIRIPLVPSIIPLHPPLDISRHRLHQIGRRRIRFPPLRESGDDTVPHSPPHLLVLQIFSVFPRTALSDFCTGGLYLHPEDPGGSKFRGVGVARVLPALGDEVVGDELHGVQALGLVRDDVGVAEDDGGAVVATVVIGGEGEDDAVEEGGTDADWDPPAAGAVD